MHKQKNVEKAVRKALAHVNEVAGAELVASVNEVEHVAYRIRAIMSHARNTRLGMWQIPRSRATPTTSISPASSFLPSVTRILILAGRISVAC